MATEITGMVQRRGAGLWLTHLAMIAGVLVIFFPIWLAFVASTVTQPEIVRPPMPLWPGDQLIENYTAALFSGVNVPVLTMLGNSLVMAVGIAVGKIVISLTSAFAIVYFRFPGRNLFFWLIFLTLMLPVEVRIVPTYEVIAGFGMLNSYSGLIFPLIASATATFLFRQFYLTVPDELAEAARVDGARPMRFFWDILLPMSRTNIATTRRADDDDEFAVCHRQAHALDHLFGAKAFVDIVQFYGCHVTYFSLSTRPRIKSFCIETTTTTGGIIARIEVAMMTGQFAKSSPEGNICLMPITMVFIDGSVVIRSGQRN